MVRCARELLERFVASVVLLCMAMPADAHLVSTGLGPVYDSVSHFLLSPESVAPVCGVALLAGLRGADHARWTLFTLSGGWLAGELIGMAPPGGLGTSLLTAGTCLVIGMLVAADLRLSVRLIAVIAVAVGFLDGGMARVAEGASAGLPGIMAACAAVFILVALAASVVVPLQTPWLRVAVRVAGSWLAALGLLLLGWALRTR